MSSFRTFMCGEFPAAEAVLISDTNNDVYKVSSSDGTYVVKNMTDSDIPVEYLASASERLGRVLPVQRIHRVYSTAKGARFDAIVAEYIEGEDLATILERGTPPSVQGLVEFFTRFVSACADLPRKMEGFCLFKRDAPVFATHEEFVLHYARRYWSRVRVLYERTSVGAAVDYWLTEGFAQAARRHSAQYGTIAIDANLKNFIVRSDGGIVLLNVPIVGVSTPAHAVGAISVHLRHLSAHDALVAEARRSLCPMDHEMIPHFELWGYLGILSFYAVSDPGRREHWRNWGAPVMLHDSFTELVESCFSSGQ